MARRKSYQKGSIEWKNGKPTLKYELRVCGKWLTKRESMPEWVDTQKQANQHRDQRMMEINQINNAIQRPVVGGAPPMTLESLVKGRWAQYISERELKPSTVYSYDSVLRTHILPELGAQELKEITPQHLSDFRDKLSESLSSKTYRNIYWLLTQLFAVAKDFDLIEKSPVRPSLHRPRRISKKEKPRLSSEETLRVLQEIPNEHRLIFVLDVVIAVRAGELLGLRWLDFRPEQRALAISSSIWRGKLGTPKTEASVRVVHIPSSVVELLTAHREASAFKRDEDFIFARSDGRSYDQDHLRNIVLYPALLRAGIKREARSYGFHLFRHTAGSIVHELTSDLKLSQELLAHSHISTTADIYVHGRREAKAEKATELLASQFVPVFPEEPVVEEQELVSEMVQ